MLSSVLQHEFETAFREIQIKFSRVYAQILSDEDLTLPQYALLSLLAGPSLMRMSEASSKLHISKPAVTHLVDQLEKKKYLKRQAHETDRRCHLLALTPRGKKAVTHTQNRVLSFILRTMEQFPPAAQKVIVDFYKKAALIMDRELQKGDYCGKP